MTTAAPDVVTRYLQAADARDSKACANCFTENGTVLDEGKTYRGRAEILAWREDTLGRFTYTTTVTGSEPVSDGKYRVSARIVGDFPGATADLTYDFTLDGDLIADLRIVG
jgi:ketosteroid isomerase-like protein